LTKPKIIFTLELENSRKYADTFQNNGKIPMLKTNNTLTQAWPKQTNVVGLVLAWLGHVT
jgi:hypothetical protein